MITKITIGFMFLAAVLLFAAGVYSLYENWYKLTTVQVLAVLGLVAMLVGVFIYAGDIIRSEILWWRKYDDR